MGAAVQRTHGPSARGGRGRGGGGVGHGMGQQGATRGSPGAIHVQPGTSMAPSSFPNRNTATLVLVGTMVQPRPQPTTQQHALIAVSQHVRLCAFTSATFLANATVRADGSWGAPITWGTGADMGGVGCAHRWGRQGTAEMTRGRIDRDAHPAPARQGAEHNDGAHTMHVGGRAGRQGRAHGANGVENDVSLRLDHGRDLGVEGDSTWRPAALRPACAPPFSPESNTNLRLSAVAARGIVRPAAEHEKSGFPLGVKRQLGILLGAGGSRRLQDLGPCTRV